MSFELAFPYGCYVVGEITAVNDFEASMKDRPVSSRDKETGELVWAVPVMDADPAVKGQNKTITVKISAPVMPVLPEVPAELAAYGVQLIPAVLDGLTVTPWVNGSNRLAYSYRVAGVRALPMPNTPAADREAEQDRAHVNL
ncbi:plasmid replication, integration and excision activator [Streptosporangium sp. NPDC006007]|uniref:plasmid replication, integration and excision activator n=1 Tax=Streptosporangium sp. NPDC006007 TaxID=3154575 RepID=UPI0033A323D4